MQAISLPEYFSFRPFRPLVFTPLHSPVIGLTIALCCVHLSLQDGPKETKVIEVTQMTDTPRPAGGGLAKRLPLLIILVVAAIGAFTLREYLSFQALADNREALIAFLKSL